MKRLFSFHLNSFKLEFLNSKYPHIDGKYAKNSIRPYAFMKGTVPIEKKSRSIRSIMFFFIGLLDRLKREFLSIHTSNKKYVVAQSVLYVNI